MPVYGFYDNDIRQSFLDGIQEYKLESFVQQIAAAVEKPSDTPLCEL